jgi:pilus assembly protein CpaC
MTCAARRLFLALSALLVVPASQGASADAALASAQNQVEAPRDEFVSVIKSQHRRMAFGQDIQRIAVGDTEILSAELLTSREVLVLGRETGRTTLIVWFVNGSLREYLSSVQRDLRTRKTTHRSPTSIHRSGRAAGWKGGDNTRLGRVF